jgi:hypothetical protein
VAEAYISVTWWPLDNAHFRFMSFDYVDNKVPVNAVGMAELTEPNRSPANPVTSRASVRDHLQSLQQGGVNKFLGYQLYGGCRVGKVSLDVAIENKHAPPNQGPFSLQLVPA